MPKFSIIIPVKNTEKYIKKCIESIKKQTYKDYEIIVINDNSTDNSMNIVKEYKDITIIENDIKGIGPSRARNLGVTKSKGEYILFLDSDDYYEEKLLENINKELDEKYNIVRFEIKYDGIEKELKKCQKTETYENGIEAFEKICTYSIVESPCCYAFNREYFIKNKFKFKENTLHEDFGLIPLIIIKAQKVKCINYVGYNYVIHPNSIMTSNTYDKILKKTKDFLEHYKYLMRESRKIKGNLKTFQSYLANSVILKSTNLKGKEYKEYITELKKIKVYDKLLEDTIGRKIKKRLIKINPKIYYKVVK